MSSATERRVFGLPHLLEPGQLADQLDGFAPADDHPRSRIDYRVQRDGITLAGGSGSVYGTTFRGIGGAPTSYGDTEAQVASFTDDTPPAGTHTYTLQLFFYGGGGVPLGTIAQRYSNRGLLVIETKR